ncbi:MAG: hypothetical protein IJ550_09195, partial [Bacteroidaceae bacterium]|nr:hypothetical protein [Bacteroidaceae bacterium]
FEPAWEAMEAKSPDYDIEETVRAMNALEVAQCQSEDFMSYLEYVAKQDFSRVAPEVLEQKKKLFPILQRLYELQKEYKELDDVWMLMRSATSGATTFASEVNPVGVIGSMLTGDATLSTVSLGSGMDKAKTAAFEEYEKQKELKRQLEREIEAVRMSYVQYLEDYAPVYYKYMQEWDALCLKKDKAYIDLYGGQPMEAYNQSQEILKEYPTNREALLLKGLSLIQMSSEVGNLGTLSSSMEYDLSQSLRGADEAIALADSVLAGVATERSASDERTELQMEAEATLDHYMKLYPSRSAPALVLKGLLYREQGEIAKAVSYFDQASMEYPRQAAALTDLLDSYKARTYLNKSAEGKYLLRLYRSTMEGFGIFSPNLLKANYYAQNGDVEKSKEEIFNHFYRRGNQGVYDCLLSDMQYCEENMYSSFRQILLEQSFLDVAVEPTTNWTLADKEDEIKVTINNRSDIDLENVRIFLCLHYTDMYKDEYDVQKLPSVNIIKHNDKTEIGVVKLNYEDKKYNDITRIRAIAMTDDKICWIDNVNYKYMKASEAAARDNNSKPSTHNSQLSTAKQQLLEDFNVDNGKLQSIIQEGMKVYGIVSDGNLWNDMKRDVKNLMTGKDKKLRIELPRILTLIDPVFSLHQLNDKDKAIRPSENYLSGSNIRLKFDYEPKQDETIPLYIYSDFANFKVTIKFEGGKPVVKKVDLL